MRGLEFGTPYSETATHATAAVATHAAVTGKTYYVTNVTVSSDIFGSASIKTGTTVLWQLQVGTASVASISFNTPLKGDTGSAVSVEIRGSTECKANIAGYEL